MCKSLRSESRSRLAWLVLLTALVSASLSGGGGGGGGRAPPGAPPPDLYSPHPL
jgi:hypothetical protein